MTLPLRFVSNVHCRHLVNIQDHKYIWVLVHDKWVDSVFCFTQFESKKAEEESDLFFLSVFKELSVVLSGSAECRPAAGCSSYQQRVASLHSLLNMLIWHQAV